MAEMESHKEPPPHLDRIGLFEEMSYIRENILKVASSDAKSSKGKQILSSCAKSKAGNQDGYFQTNFIRAFEGEAYTDQIRLNRLSRLENAKKNLEPHFKYTSPTRKPSGRGSNYGTFTDHGEKITYFSTKGCDVVKGLPQRKNFLTNPAKKGTGYGYPNVTIGKVPPYFLENEYEELKNLKVEPKRTETRPFEPYRAGLFPQTFFNPNPFSTGDKTLSTKEEINEVKKIEPPFKPTNPTKKDGGMKAGCLNPFPVHASEPPVKLDLVPRGVKTYLNDKNQMFRPVPGIRPYPVKSIINTNVQKRVTPKNFTTVKGVVYCKN